MINCIYIEKLHTDKFTFVCLTGLFIYDLGKFGHVKGHNYTQKSLSQMSL